MSDRKNAMNAFSKIKSGKQKQMKEDTFQRYKCFYTPEQIEFLRPELTPKPITVNFDFDIKDKLKNNPNESIKQSTKDKHSFQLGGLLNTFGVDKFEELISTRPKEEIVNTLTEVYADSGTYINLIIIILKHIAPELGNEIDLEFYEKQKVISKNKQVVNSFQARSADTTDYQIIYDNLHNYKPKNITQEIILGLYTYGIYDNSGTLRMIPRNYFYKVEIGDDLNVNSYNPETGKINIVEFKTDKNFKYNYTLPDKLNKFIKISLENCPRKYLIGKGGEHYYTVSSMNALVKASLGINIGVYRKTMENILGLTYDRLTVCNAMAHSPQTAFQEYLIN